MLQRLTSGDENPSIEKRRAASPNKHRLNDRFIGDLKPQTKPFLVWDTLQHGLAVQVQPSGHVAFKCIYSRNGRSRWYHIANANAINVKAARKLTGEIMVAVANGKDPAADRKASRHAGTFEDLAKRYAKHAATVNKSWESTDKLIKSYVLPEALRVALDRSCVRVDVLDTIGTDDVPKFVSRKGPQFVEDYRGAIAIRKQLERLCRQEREEMLDAQ